MKASKEVILTTEMFELVLKTVLSDNLQTVEYPNKTTIIVTSKLNDEVIKYTKCKHPK